MNAQNRIFSRFCGTNLRKSIQENFSLENLEYLLNNKIGFSSVIYIDIFNFSKKISGSTTVDVRNYLNDYYNSAMPIIQKHGGQIDKIMGDGIIVVFSKIFQNFETDRDAVDSSFYCCKELIETFYDTNFEAKSAIGIGKLFFCKTGVEQIYEEYTALGHPMTIVYRLENIANKNQILVMRDTKLSQRIEDSQYDIQFWSQSSKTVFLKGIGLSNISILQYL
jgi:class 3 adenylate cyclase